MVESLNNLYTSLEEMQAKAGVAAVTAWFDDDSTGTVNTDALTDILEDATDEINLYLEAMYDPADMVNNKWVRNAACHIALHLASGRRGNASQYTDDYERTLQRLQAIANQQMQVPRLPTRAYMAPTMSNIRVDDRFGHRKNRTQTDNSVGPTYGGQDTEYLNPDLL